MRMSKNSVSRGHVVLVVLALTALGLMAAGAGAATYTWDGDDLDAYLINGPNWVGDFAPDFSELTEDDLIFAGSTNTSPLIPALLSLYTMGVTFDATAAPFTISSESDDYLYVGFNGSGAIVNNSANTQTLNAVSMYLGTIDAANGPLMFPNAFNVDVANVTVQGNHDVRFANLASAGTSSKINKTGNNTLHVDGGSNWAGQLAIGGGAVRISTNTSLGATASKTTISGGDNNARLELTGGITVAEQITYGGKSNTNPCILNISGNNTLTGTMTSATGGAYYVFRSNADLLTIQSNLTSPTTGSGGNRRIYLRGAGDGEIKGAIIDQGLEQERYWEYLNKYDTGTWTLSGVNTTSMPIRILGGTLALKGAGSINNSTAILAYSNTTTFNVSGLTSGLFTLGSVKKQYLYGRGAVVGNVSVAADSRITPGANTSYTEAGMGRLTFDGNLSFQTGGIYKWELGALTDDLTGVAGADFDQILLKNGNLDLGPDAKLSVNFAQLAAADRPTADPRNAFWDVAHIWKIIDIDADNGGANAGGTNFGTIVISGTQPTGLTFSTYVGTTTGVDLGDIFLKCVAGLGTPGDANGDGHVDQNDAAILAGNWLQRVSGKAAAGDFNEDGVVNDLDASILAAHWAYGSPTAAVPEPGAIMILLGLAIGFGLLRRVGGSSRQRARSV